MSNIDRKALAKAALAAGAYLQFNRTTYRIDSCELDDEYVNVTDPNDEFGSTSITRVDIDEFVADNASKVMELRPIFDNSLEDPVIINVAMYREQIVRAFIDGTTQTDGNLDETLAPF